ncbi:MAG: glycosyltransferase family 2 protein [Leptospiraceae bacterium]|nr:glycosyltransferase family 2 protein [Leptospiraceae bacterium]
MAGSDEVFREAGYAYPKNLIEINGKPLVERVIRSFDGLAAQGARFLFLIRQSEIQKHHTASVVRLLVPDAEVIPIPGDTAGAACTALWAIDQINNDTPLLITNGDQILEIDYPESIAGFSSEGVDGGVLGFEAVHPRWSYVKVNASGFVIEAAEKRPISRLATAGTYYFKRGRDFVTAAQRMILKDAHVDGVFYICPVFNEMILEQASILARSISQDTYFQFKTPRGLQEYESLLRDRMRAGRGEL